MEKKKKLINMSTISYLLGFWLLPFIILLIIIFLIELEKVRGLPIISIFIFIMFLIIWLITYIFYKNNFLEGILEFISLVLDTFIQS